MSDFEHTEYIVACDQSDPQFVDSEGDIIFWEELYSKFHGANEFEGGVMYRVTVKALKPIEDMGGEEP